MLAETMSAAIRGVDAVPVRVEVDVAFGLPGLTIVGLPGSAVQEARERVRSAIRNSGFEVPARRITVNLAPADLPKEGTAHDLAIGVGLLAASGQLDADLAHTALIAELALDGSLRPVSGTLALVAAARDVGHRAALVARDDLAEAAAVPGIAIHAASSLGDAVAHLAGVRPIPVAAATTVPAWAPPIADVDLRRRDRSTARAPSARDRARRPPQPRPRRATGGWEDPPPDRGAGPSPTARRR